MMRLLFVLTYLMLGSFCWAQDDGEKLYDHELDEQKWEKLRDGIRYEGTKNGPGRQWTYESQEEYYKARREYEEENGGGSGGSGGGGGQGDGYGGGDAPQDRPSDDYTYEESSPPPSTSAPSASGLGALGYIFMGLFIVGLAVLIYYMFINAPRDGKKISAIQDIEEVNPTEIPLTELQRLLQEALANGDYRGAVRIYFIFIIRDLAEKRWIAWEKEKTNMHYLREMTGKPEFDDFNRSVSYFEIIWYGKREIDSSKFEQVKPNFTRLLARLGVE